MSADGHADQERVIWEGRTSWMDHAVLFVFLALALVRGLVAVRGGEWMVAVLYAMAIAAFLGIAAWFHYGRYYRLTSVRVQVRSGWNGRLLQELLLKDISDITLRYELLNRWFDLGTLELASRSTEECCTIRGIPHPEELKARLQRWIQAQRNPWASVPARGTPDHAQS